MLLLSVFGFRKEKRNRGNCCQNFNFGQLRLRRVYSLNFRKLLWAPVDKTAGENKNQGNQNQKDQLVSSKKKKGDREPGKRETSSVSCLDSQTCCTSDLVSGQGTWDARADLNSACLVRRSLRLQVRSGGRNQQRVFHRRLNLLRVGL